MDDNFKNAYASLAKDPSKRSALAELLVEWLDTRHITENIVGLFLNTRRLNPGDALLKKVRRGIEVHTLVPGAVHLANEITVDDRINYMLDGADVKVRANLWELESGELGTVADIRREMQLKLSDYFASRVFTSLASIWTAVNTPDNYVAVANLNAATLRAAIDSVRYSVGEVRAVVGTRLGLAAVTEFGGFHTDPTAGTNWGVDDAIREVYRTGWLGQWRGAPIVALDQVWNNPIDNDRMLPDRYVLVIAENAGEFISYGEPKWKEWTDMNPTPPDWFLEVYQQFGLIVDKAQGICVIDITSLA